MKKLFLVILLLVATVGYSQQTVNTQYFNAGVSYDVGTFAYDTAGALATTAIFTQYFEGTGIDGQTLYLTYDMITAGSTNDSVLVIIQGFIPTGTTGMVLNCDSLYMVGSTTSSIKQLTLSPTGFAPKYRIRLIHYYAGAADQKNAAITSIKLNVYAKSIDPVYKWNTSWY